MDMAGEFGGLGGILGEPSDWKVFVLGGGLPLIPGDGGAIPGEAFIPEVNICVQFSCPMSPAGTLLSKVDVLGTRPHHIRSSLPSDVEGNLRSCMHCCSNRRRAQHVTAHL